jgi:hypothetical protein
MSRVAVARQCSTLYKAMRKTLKGLLCPDQNPRHCSMFPVHVNRCRVHALVEGSCRQSLALLIIAASVAGDGTLRPPPKTGMHSHWSTLPQAAGSGRANAPRRSHHALTVSKAAPVQAKVMVRQAAHASPGACRRVPPYLTSRPSARPASSGEFKIQFKLQQLSKILRNSKFCPKFMKLVLLGSFLIDLSSKNVKHTYMSHEIIR